MSEKVSKSVFVAILQALGIALAFAVIGLIVNGIEPGYFARLIGAVPRGEFEQLQKHVKDELDGLKTRLTSLETSGLKDHTVIMLRNIENARSLISDKNGDLRTAPGGVGREYEWQILRQR